MALKIVVQSFLGDMYITRGEVNLYPQIKITSVLIFEAFGLMW